MVRGSVNIKLDDCDELNESVGVVPAKVPPSIKLPDSSRDVFAAGVGNN